MSKDETPVEAPAQENITVTAEQLLDLLKGAEIVAADRLVILRVMEGFFNSIDQARTRLLSDIQEINNSIAHRDTPSNDTVASEEEE